MKYAQGIKTTLEALLLLALIAYFIFIGKDKLAAFYYNRGRDYYEAESYKEAIKSFNRSLEISPLISKTHYSLANAYGADGQAEKAIEEYKKSIQVDEHFLWGYEALVDIYLQKRDYSEAFALLKVAESHLPESQEIQDLINTASFKQVAYYMNSGVDAFLAGEKSKGYELLNQALEINPEFAGAYYTLGYFYYTENKYDKALSMLNKALSLDSKFVLTHKLLGDIYFGKGVFNKAIDEYKEAIMINDRDPILFNNLGLSYMNLEDYNEAVKFLERAVDLDSSNINFHYNLASVYRDAGRAKDALPEYLEVVKYQPEYLNVHNDLGDIYKHKGQPDQALTEYQKEVKYCRVKLLSTGDDPVLLNIMAYAYNGLGQYAKAKELIVKALTIKPDSREAHLTYANILNNLGEHQSALQSLDRAKKLSGRKQVFIEQKVEDLKEELRGIAASKEGPKFNSTDAVYLKNGRHFEGVIIGETKDKVTLKINLGTSIGTVTLSKDDILRKVSKN
ncbi:MAG: tetratricopeptide repeat protein [Candidatus Omnitrophota bacterium]